MPEVVTPESFLAACSVRPEVFELRPDYRALLLIIDGLTPDISGAGSAAVDALVLAAETYAHNLMAECPLDEQPHIASWREAYRAFGAKPQRTRNSLEALTRRAEKGLPRVNAITDIYNAISVMHQIPIGGEDYDRYHGPARVDPCRRRRVVRLNCKRRERDRASRARRGGLVRHRRRDVPAMELAAVPTHKPHSRNTGSILYCRRPHPCHR